jgi:hypothetical protein
MKRFLVIPVLLVAFGCAEAQSAAPISYSVAPDMNVTLKNVSGKPIVALMVDIVGIQTMIPYRHDFFTKPVQFDPDATIDNVVDPAGDPDVKQWKVTIVWCQFTDGSQWGDVPRGKVMLDMRREALTMFDSLATASDADVGPILDKVTASASRDRVALTGTAQLLRETMASKGTRPCGTFSRADGECAGACMKAGYVVTRPIAMTDKPRITRDFTINPRGPLPTAVGVYYERYRQEKGSVPAPQAEAMLFAEYLLEHLEEFQAELKDVYMAMPWPDPPK